MKGLCGVSKTEYTQHKKAAHEISRAQPFAYLLFLLSLSSEFYVEGVKDEVGEITCWSSS